MSLFDNIIDKLEDLKFAVDDIAFDVTDKITDVKDSIVDKMEEIGEDVTDKIEDIGQMAMNAGGKAIELGQILNEGKQGLDEFAFGFFEEDFKVSFEIKDEANSIINKANEKYEKKCIEINNLINQLNEKINVLYMKEIQIAKNFNLEINKTKEQLENIQCKHEMNRDDVLTLEYEKEDLLREGKKLLKESSAKERQLEAKLYFKEAKNYELKVDKKIEILDQKKHDINFVKKIIDDELLLLNDMKKLLNEGILLDDYEIIGKFKDLVEEYILDIYGKINVLYYEKLETLKLLVEKKKKKKI